MRLKLYQTFLCFLSTAISNTFEGPLYPRCLACESKRSRMCIWDLYGPLCVSWSYETRSFILHWLVKLPAKSCKVRSNINFLWTNLILRVWPPLRMGALGHTRIQCRLGTSRAPLNCLFICLYSSLQYIKRTKRNCLHTDHVVQTRTYSIRDSGSDFVHELRKLRVASWGLSPQSCAWEAVAQTTKPPRL